MLQYSSEAVVSQWVILGDSIGFLGEKHNFCSLATARLVEKQEMSRLSVNGKAKIELYNDTEKATC